MCGLLGGTIQREVRRAYRILEKGPLIQDEDISEVFLVEVNLRNGALQGDQAGGRGEKAGAGMQR